MRVTEGVTPGVQFLVTLSSPADDALTVNLSAPRTVTLVPASVAVSKGQMQSAPVTVTAGHDRNVTSEKVEITATVSGGKNYNGQSGTIAALAADDDYSLSVVISNRTRTTRFSNITENTPFTDVMRGG